MNYNVVHIYPIFVEIIFILEVKALNINYAQKTPKNPNIIESWLNARFRGGNIENSYLMVHIHDIHENTYKLDYDHRSCDMLDNIHDYNVSTCKLDIAMITNSQISF